MKILIISGFLGAGKTTFIKHLSKATGYEIAILENEYGAFNVDSDILKEDSDGINIWEMTEGCICCSTKKSFAESVLTIANTIDPQYLVIEPTGVGILSNIIKNLKQIEYERTTLLAPVTIVDGNSYHHYIHEFPQLYKDQLMFASTIIISKMEDATYEQYQQLSSNLKKINSKAHILTQHYSQMSSVWFQQLLNTGYDGKILKETTVMEELPDSLSLEDIYLTSLEGLILFMENLIRGHYGSIIRAKGYIKINTLLLRFDMTDSSYSITGAEESASPKAVFIGKHIDRQGLRRILYAASPKIKVMGNKTADKTFPTKQIKTYWTPSKDSCFDLP